MELKGNKIYLTCEEWKTVGFPAPPLNICDLTASNGNDLVCIPVMAVPEDIYEAQDRIYQHYEKRISEGAEILELVSIDSVAARLARIVGLDPETLTPIEIPDYSNNRK